MSSVQIYTHLQEGHGSIEMRHEPNEPGLGTIHDLGLLEGASAIVELEERGKQSLILGYGHTEADRLDRNARSIATALHESGMEVSVNETLPVAPDTPKPGRVAKLLARLR